MSLRRGRSSAARRQRRQEAAEARAAELGEGTDTGNSSDASAVKIDLRKDPRSFFYAAAIFLLTFVLTFQFTVTRPGEGAAFTQCRYDQIDNLIGGVLMLLLAAFYAFRSGEIIRKTAFYSLMYSLVTIGGLYLLYSFYLDWQSACERGFRFTIQP